MGNSSGKEQDRNASGFSTSGDGHYTHTEAAEVLSGSDITSRLELTFEAKSLRNKDYFSKSDPFLVCSIKSGTNEWKELMRTEIIANNLNPKWVNAAYLSYNFNEVQDILIEVYDVASAFTNSDASKLRLGSQNYVGKFMVPVATLVNQSKYIGTLISKNTKKIAGTVKISTEEVKNTNMYLKLGFGVKDVPSRGFTSRSSFIRISKQSGEDKTEYVPCYKTEVRGKTKDPMFAALEGPVLQLTNGDLDRGLRLILYQWMANGQHIYTGELDTTLNQLKHYADNNLTVSFEDKQGTRKRGKDNRGEFFVYKFELDRRSTFLDFIRGGCALNFMVGVDFTMSNKQPTDPKSLHYVDPRGVMNPYAMALTGTTQVLNYYDSSKTYACYGFGGKARGGAADHCFPLNGNRQNPYVEGVDGILAAYHNALFNMELSGPTILSPLIHQATAFARQRQVSQDYQHYTVLLIITDGVVSDMDQTINAICDASAFPVSVLILGVGTEDFDQMEGLAGRKIDKKLPQTRGGRIPLRDIVTFVNMQSFSRYAGYGNIYQQMVTKALLDRLPSQVLEFFATKKITPNEPLPPPAYEEPSEAVIDAAATQMYGNTDPNASNGGYNAAPMPPVPGTVHGVPSLPTPGWPTR